MNTKTTLYWKLLFDEACPMCRKFARIIEEHDSDDAIEFISLQEFNKQDKSIALEILLEEVHLLGQSGEVLRGSAAIEKIISLVPYAKPLRWMIETRWGKKSTRVLYSTLKKFRRCSSCGR